LNDLLTIVNENTDDQFNEEVRNLNRYIQYAKKRKYVDDIQEAPESDHSNTSISELRSFLENYDFKNLQEPTDISEESEEHLQDLHGVVLAPDLIGYWKDKECWIELKEYRDLKFNSKVVFQVFRYLLQKSFVILISISPLPSFTELLEKKVWTAENLQKWAFKHQTRMQQDLSNWNNARKGYMELGKTIKLTPRHETLLLTLTNEIVTREIGLIGTELRGIEKFLEIVNEFNDEIYIREFDEFYKDEIVAPTKPCLIVKMDYSVNE
jgi:hypothetical protein